MEGIVIQLQQDALDSSKLVSELLRKAKVVATKLGLGDARHWIDRELAGYVNASQAPAYRRVRGTLKGHNPFHGMQPVRFEDSETLERFSHQTLVQPVAELEALVSSPGGILIAPLPHLQLEAEIPAYFEISKPALKGVLDAVRNLVLDWALELESKGIVGEGLRFSAEEHKTAATTHPTINFYGGVTTANLQQNPVNSPQQIYVGPRVDEIRGLLEELENLITAADMDPSEKREAEAALIIARSETSKPKPSLDRLGKTLALLKDTLQGVNAAGQVLSQLAEAFGSIGS